MRRTILLLLGTLGCAACVASIPPGPGSADPAGRPYRLPFEAGTRRLCVQAAHGPFSHQDRQRFAYDFAMPIGTPVVAARAGRVVRVKEDSSTGGPTQDRAAEGNHVVVQHEDGTRAVYLHLVKDGAVVEVGDAVRQGEVIALSGDTGWAAIPHLHIHVEVRGGESVPMHFADVKGDGAPQMLLWYVSGNTAP